MGTEAEAIQSSPRFFLVSYFYEILTSCTLDIEDVPSAAAIDLLDSDVSYYSRLAN